MDSRSIVLWFLRYFLQKPQITTDFLFCQAGAEGWGVAWWIWCSSNIHLTPVVMATNETRVVGSGWLDSEGRKGTFLISGRVSKLLPMTEVWSFIDWVLLWRWLGLPLVVTLLGKKVGMFNLFITGTSLAVWKSLWATSKNIFISIKCNTWL